LPEIFEPLGGELCVPRRVLDVAMAKPLLDRSSVVPVVRELKAARMAKHVRVNREGELGRHADPSELLAKAGRSHRGQALGGKDVRAGWYLLFVQATQSTDFGAAQNVRRGTAVLQPPHMQETLVEVDHIPAQSDKLAGAQAVSVGDEDHGAVAMSVPAKPIATGLTQALDLLAGQELTRSNLCVGAPARRKCPILDGRGPLPNGHFSFVFHRPMIAQCPIYSHNWESSRRLPTGVMCEFDR
jgi:hypothetical protein